MPPSPWAWGDAQVGATFSTPAGVSDDMQVYHVWETLPDLSHASPASEARCLVQFWFENGLSGSFGTIVQSRLSTRLMLQVPGGLKLACYGGEANETHCVVPYPLVATHAYNLKLVRAASSRSGDGARRGGDSWSAVLIDMVGGRVITFAELVLPDDRPLRRGFGGLQTRAVASHEYAGGTSSCTGRPLSSVGLIGPWWHGATPDQAFAHYSAGCANSDVGTCVYGAGCGAPRVLFTSGSNTTATTGQGQPLWNSSREASGYSGGPHAATSLVSTPRAVGLQSLPLRSLPPYDRRPPATRARVHAASIRWSFVTGDLVDSTPALSPDGSVLYFGSRDNKLYAVGAADGALRWSYATGGPIASSPAVSRDGATVFIGSWDNRTHAVDATTGQKRWAFVSSRPAFRTPGPLADPVP